MSCFWPGLIPIKTTFFIDPIGDSSEAINEWNSRFRGFLPVVFVFQGFIEHTRRAKGGPVSWVSYINRVLHWRSSETLTSCCPGARASASASASVPVRVRATSSASDSDLDRPCPTSHSEEAGSILAWGHRAAPVFPSLRGGETDLVG